MNSTSIHTLPLQGPHYFTEWTGTDRNSSLFYGTERTVQCTRRAIQRNALTNYRHWTKNGISYTNDSRGKVYEIHSLHVLHVSFAYPLPDTSSLMYLVGHVGFPYVIQVKYT